MGRPRHPSYVWFFMHRQGSPIPVAQWCGNAILDAESDAVPASVALAAATKVRAARTATEAADTADAELVTAFVEKTIAAIPSTERNNHLYRAARKLYGLAKEGLWDEWDVSVRLEQQAALVGLPAKEVRPTLKSAQRSARPWRLYAL